MNQFSINTLILLILLFFCCSSQATLITNLTQAELDSHDYSNAEDHLTTDLLDINYIGYKGYDWAWVSSRNLELSGGNILYAPDVQKNWQFANNALLSILKTELTLGHFTANNGDLIQSVQFFNSDYSLLDSTSMNDFNSGFVNSEWTIPDSVMWDLFRQQDTFYVRETQTSSPTSIPEPSTFILFVFAVTILATKKRIFS